jgi:TolA-binding protein
LDWESLAKRGRYQQALAAAEQVGIDELTSTLGAEKLLRLADVARIGGKPSLAQRILFGLRKRFPGTSSAGLAAYTLGVTAFDQKRSFPEAAGWFSTYLSEQPGGPLSQEALGRLAEALQRSGQTESARNAATRYLKAYPEGPHRELARRVLDE